MKLRSELVIVLIFFSIFFIGCQSREQKDEQTARQYCASCHLFPEPALLSKSVWEKDVLPQMAFHMGIDFTLLKKFSFDDQDAVSAALPNAAMVTDEQWQAIKRYYQDKAPDTIVAPIPAIADTLRQFVAESVVTTFYPMNTFVSFDSASDELFVGSRLAKLYRFDKNLNIIDSAKLPSAPSQIKFISKDKILLLAMGIMDPNDQAAGSLLAMDLATKQYTTIIDSLKRPVYFQQVDLDKNGKDDFVICEFGNFSGALSAYKNTGNNQYERKELISLPGARKVITTDLDGNGFQDIIALMSQGDEKIVVLFNHGDFIFRMTTLLKFPPVYGSSYFDLVDLNGDKKLDILYTNGDNADFSMILKPYHGVRTFINQGSNDFKESWFYNVHGASQAMARDFDHDGDLDIAVISFFPPFENHAEQGFVYFENNGGRYDPQITKLASKGRWITFSCADVDRDGDEDILLSALDFNNGTPANLLGKWKSEKVSLLVLRNKLK
ncbi:MAG: VCBS repeat-containing protein [Chryseolinea sp.]